MFKFYLDEYLTNQHISAYWLSKQTGISTNNISDICNNGKKGIQLSSLYKICKALNCQLSDIIKDDEGIVGEKSVFNITTDPVIIPKSTKTESTDDLFTDDQTNEKIKRIAIQVFREMMHNGGTK